MAGSVVRWTIGVSISAITVAVTYSTITQADRIKQIDLNLAKRNLSVSFDKPKPAEVGKLLYKLKSVHPFAASALNMVSGVVQDKNATKMTSDGIRKAIIDALTATEPAEWKGHQIDVSIAKSPSSMLHQDQAQLINYIQNLELLPYSSYNPINKMKLKILSNNMNNFSDFNHFNHSSRLHSSAAACDDDIPAGTQAKAIDGSVSIFKTGLTDGQISDSLNSMLLAQLAANKVADRQTNTIAWYNKYTEVLENIGWAITSFDFTYYHSSGDSFSVDTAVLEVMASIASGDDIKLMQAVMTRLRANQNQPGLVLFSDESHNDHQSNFQVGLVWNDNGVLSTRLGSFTYDSNTSSTSVLFFSCSSSDIQLKKAAQNISLSDSVFSKVRQAIVDKLGDRAINYIASLDI